MNFPVHAQRNTKENWTPTRKNRFPIVMVHLHDGWPTEHHLSNHLSWTNPYDSIPFTFMLSVCLMRAKLLTICVVISSCMIVMLLVCSYIWCVLCEHFSLKSFWDQIPLIYASWGGSGSMNHLRCECMYYKCQSRYHVATRPSDHWTSVRT